MISDCSTLKGSMCSAPCRHPLACSTCSGDPCMWSSVLKITSATIWRTSVATAPPGPAREPMSRQSSVPCNFFPLLIALSGSRPSTKFCLEDGGNLASDSSTINWIARSLNRSLRQCSLTHNWSAQWLETTGNIAPRCPEQNPAIAASYADVTSESMELWERLASATSKQTSFQHDRHGFPVSQSSAATRRPPSLGSRSHQSAKLIRSSSS
mmetsp:Transcript_74884/g.199638  ORF Transcript_74884/g.199638 Transcript_74884/m.199638 type:complete len:211 (+) Transcript_74884:1493-2125(+)